ncbi:MAG TPA: hypothetical protein VGN35_08475 [Jatrophihabitantaceae bacterium]|jgi:hypothetical protein|nr:hypothetical protein [Jatrophihabitantaceae bacterium]
MTETPTPRARLRWIVASILATIAVVLVVLLVTLLLPARHRHQHAAAQVGLTATESAAVDAASKQVINLLSYSRKSFDADYARARSGATGALAQDLSDAAKKNTLLSQMTSGKFDLQGQVTASAFEESSGGNYAVLISAQGFKVPDSGSKTLASTARFEITMSQVKGKWLASNLVSVGLV